MGEEASVYHLQMYGPPSGDFPPLPDGFRVWKVSPPHPPTNARFYREVGGPWLWREQLVWSDEDWEMVVDRTEFHTWIAESGGDEVGYFEMEQQDGGDVEIVHFGLIESSIGRGLGSVMLREAIRVAWELPGTRRLWLHTCTRDHPGALANYQRRGFELFKTEIEQK